jgi:hypothetical protein
MPLSENRPTRRSERAPKKREFYHTETLGADGVITISRKESYGQNQPGGVAISQKEKSIANKRIRGLALIELELLPRGWKWRKRSTECTTESILTAPNVPKENEQINVNCFTSKSYEAVYQQYKDDGNTMEKIIARGRTGVTIVKSGDRKRAAKETHGGRTEETQRAVPTRSNLQTPLDTTKKRDAGAVENEDKKRAARASTSTSTDDTSACTPPRAIGTATRNVFVTKKQAASTDTTSSNKENRKARVATAPSQVRASATDAATTGNLDRSRVPATAAATRGPPSVTRNNGASQTSRPARFASLLKILNELSRL